MSILEIKDLKVHYAVERGTLKAVDGVSLAMERGETLGLVGESGCGKSTLGNAILRLVKPVSGEVKFDGQDIWSFSGRQVKEYRRRVQMVFQNPYASLDPLCLIHETLAEGLRAHRLCPKEEIDARVMALARMVGLDRSHLNRFPYEFSGGQRQRIGIARALSVSPDLIVCDEPISALDVSIQAQIVNLLISLQQKTGVAYLFITHDLSMVKVISRRIAVMYLGSIVELADSQELYLHCAHPYTEALISAIPIPDPRVEAARQRILLQGDVPSPINTAPGCPFAARCNRRTGACMAQKPELRRIGEGHFVACHNV